MMQFISLSFSILILIIGHTLLWYIFIKLFHIVSLSGQIISALVILILFLNIIIASNLSRKWGNYFTRVYYIFSGIWVGVLINLGIVITLILLIKLLALILVFSLPYYLMELIFFGGTLFLSVLGIYQAFFPKVTEYKVVIKDLPEAWENKVIVQLSDVHLGTVYQKKFFYRLIKKVNKLKPEAVFITGDLFDGSEASFTWLNHPFTKLHTPQGIYYGFGNHELYLGFSRVIKLLKDNPIKILDNKLLVVAGLQIIGINFSFSKSFNLEKEILKLANYDRNKPSILLLHAPRDIAAAKRAGIDLQLSGHTHNGQIWPFNLIAKLIHKGYGYGLFKEGNFSLIVNGGAGTWGPPMRTTSRSEIVKIILQKK